MLQGNIDSFVTEAWAQGYAPDPLLTIDEWADQYRYLSQKSSSEPGLWRTDRTPYLRDIMRDLSPSSPVSKVVIMGGSQLAKSETANNLIGYIIDQAPGPTLHVMPTEKAAQKYSKSRIAPMIEESPRLREKVKDSRQRDSGTTILTKEFPGGYLSMIGANSAVDFRSQPIRYLIMDEVDSYPLDVDDEGDPIELAERRTANFPRSKILVISSPKLAAGSIINREFNLSDQRYCHVPCPFCGFYQRLIFSNFKWPEGKPKFVAYQCINCEKLIGEEHKTAMLAAHKWVPANPESDVRGYHIPSFYSPAGWYSWVDVAKNFVKSRKNPLEFKTYVNTVWGEVWTIPGESPDWEPLYARRGTFPLGQPPEQCVLITAGIDVQKDRIELEFVGWAADKQSWSLDYVVLPGDPFRPEVWRSLDEQLARDFINPNGEVLTVRRAAIDSGHAAQEVYAWARNKNPDFIMVIKGATGAIAVGAPGMVDVTISGRKIKTGLKLWPIAVGILKTEVYGYLKLKLDENGQAPPGYCHFPQYGPEYFQQLTAERQVEKIIKGIPRLQWDKASGARNEALDCRVYARAAAMAVGLDRLAARHAAMQNARPTIPQLEKKLHKQPKESSGSWVSSRKGWIKQ